MKNIEFNHAHPRWDAWQQFHNILIGAAGTHGLLTLFSTGEMIWCSRHIHNDYRAVRHNWGISLLSTDSMSGLKLRTPDGRDVPHAWLNRQGLQCVIYDHDTSRMVSVNTPDRKVEQEIKSRMPVWARNYATVYWPGPQQPPVGCPVMVQPPHKPTPEEKEHLDQLKTMCVTWKGLTGYTASSWNEYPVDPESIVKKGHTFNDLSDEDRNRIAVKGYSMWVDNEYHPYLEVR